MLFIKYNKLVDEAMTRVTMRGTRFSFKKLIPTSQILEEFFYLTALYFERLSRYYRCRPTGVAASWTGVTRMDRRHCLLMSSGRAVGITIMIVGKSLNAVRRRWMIEKKSTLMEIISDNGDVTLRSVNKHL